MPSYQLIFFIIALICCGPVLFWYYRRHAHSRFRPKVGEMVMVTLFAVLLSLGGSMLIGGLMDDPEQFRPNDGFSTMPGLPGAAGSGDMGDQRDDRKGSSSRSDSGGRDRSSRGGDSGGSGKSDR